MCRRLYIYIYDVCREGEHRETGHELRFQSIEWKVVVIGTNCAFFCSRREVVGSEGKSNFLIRVCYSFYIILTPLLSVSNLILRISLIFMNTLIYGVYMSKFFR